MCVYIHIYIYILVYPYVYIYFFCVCMYMHIDIKICLPIYKMLMYIYRRCVQKVLRMKLKIQDTQINNE